MKSIIAILATVFGLLSTPVFAQTRTVTFNATVSSVFPQSGNGMALASNLGIAVGNTITGSYAFVSNHPDSSADPGIGLYNNISLPFTINLQTGSTTYTFTSTSNRITIWNQASFDEIDVISLSSVSSNLPVGKTLGQMNVFWNGSSSALSNDALVPPPQFPWSFKRVRLLAFSDGLGNQFGLFAEISSYDVLGGHLVVADWNTPGDNLITRDTVTGLDWLDLTQTLDLSFNQVQANVGGFISAGFRFATESEVKALYQSVGITDLSNTVLSPANFPGAKLLLDLMGCTGSCGSNTPFFRGFVKLDGSTVPLSDPRTGSSFMVLDLAAQTARGNVPGGLGSKDDHDLATGSYLVRSSDAPPMANAGPDQTVNEGTLVTLDGSGSTASQGGALTFSWTQLGGSTVTLSDPTSVNPTFTAPFVSVGGETLTFQLVVTEGSQTSEPDIVNIHVVNVNKIPVADAGADQTVQEGSPVVLNGANSFDPDAEAITFSWVQTAGTAVSLSGANTANPTFTAPLVGPAGDTLTFELTVSDGIDNSQPDYVSVFVENVNHSPIAIAGADQTRDEGTLVALNGTGSTDPDGDALNYTWTQIGGPGVALSGANTANPSFTAPGVGPGGATLVFQLVVNDGLGGVSDPDEVNITVQNVNDPPACGLAQPSLATLWPPNHKLVSVGINNVSDPNNDQVAITITGVTQDEPVNGLGDGDTSPDAVLQGDKVLLRVERAGAGNGRVYQVNFSANDGQGGSCTGVVSVGVPQSMKPGNSAVDDGQLYNSTLP